MSEQRASLRPALSRGTRPRSLKVVLTLTLVVIAGVMVVAEYILHNAEPILRKRIVETLSARFHAPVELDGLSISLLKGIEVEGTGLRIPSGVEVGDANRERMPPLLAVQHFAFRTTFGGLLRQPTYVRHVEVRGLELHVPPPDRRAQVIAGWTDPDLPDPWAGPQFAGFRAKIAILVSELHCTDVRILLDPGQPAFNEDHTLSRAKAPVVFLIRSLTLRQIAAHQPMLYEADLTNPKPIGDLQISGHFGPWGGAGPGGARIGVAGGTASNLAGVIAGNAGGGPVGDTPVDGTYNFKDADLATIKGISGILSSSGRFSGVLNRIQIDGETDTPQFSLDISNHSVPLHTRFHALVDGTSGETYLQTVHARLGASDFTTSGKIVKLAGQGHSIDLAVDIPHGRMQDFLRLATRTSPPLIDGWLTMHTTLRIPPGPERVPEKLAMEGSFSLGGVRFNNPRLQTQIDGLSARASRHPERVGTAGRIGSGSRSTESHSESHLQSQLRASFTLRHGVMDVSDVRFALPGATVLMNGVYSMDGRLFEFRGHVRTEATASEMVGGWKGLLLQPLDHLLAKNGAGVELPIEVLGTEGDVHLGLAPEGTDPTPRQMLADVRAQQRKGAEMDSARRESALAGQEDLAAAHAPTLEAAERAHAAAVRHRAAAQRLALAAQDGAKGQK